MGKKEIALQKIATIKNATIVGENTAERVGETMEAMIDVHDDYVTKEEFDELAKGVTSRDYPITHGLNTFGDFSLKAESAYRFDFVLSKAMQADATLKIKSGSTTLVSTLIPAGETSYQVNLPQSGVLTGDIDSVYITLYDASYVSKTINVTLTATITPIEVKLAKKVGWIESPNLFNKDDERIVVGKYITATSIASGAGYRISHPIKVTPGVTYKFPKSSGVGSNHYFAYVDADGNRLLSYQATLSDGYLTFTASANYDYVAINLGNQASLLDTCMFCVASEFPSVYTPYYKMVDSQFSLDASKLIGEIPSSATNPLKGKIISFDGDSICYGAGYLGGYGKIIAERNGMTYENRGVAGGTIEAESYYYVAWVNGGTTYYTRVFRPIPGTSKAYTNNSFTQGEVNIAAYDQNGGTITIGSIVYTFSSASSSAKHWICRDVLNMRSDADFIILEGGVNNGGAAPNFGVVSSGYAKSTIDNFDDYYFTPAFEKMLVNVLNRFPGKKIGYIFVHKMSTYYSSNGDESNKYYLAKKCCEKWGIPYIDLNTEVPAFGLFPTDGDSGLAYLRAHYTNNGDGWHPNEEGYKKYYCDKIEAWLKTL